MSKGSIGGSDMGNFNGNCGCGNQRIVVQRRCGCGCGCHPTPTNNCGCNQNPNQTNIAKAKCQGAYEQCLRDATGTNTTNNTGNCTCHTLIATVTAMIK